jgi:hypothetical protein
MLEWLPSKTPPTTNVDEDVLGGTRRPYTLLLGMKISTTTMNAVWRLLQKLKIDLPYDPAIFLLGIYLREGQVRRK